MSFRIVTLICAALAAASVVGWYFRDTGAAVVTSVEPARDRAVVEAPRASEILPPSSPPIVEAKSPEQLADPGDVFVLPSVVGKPFELSGSVVDSCQSMPWTCTEVNAFLTRLRGEVRRESWARDLESRIARATLTRADGRYTIRALECRQSRCAIEVTSQVDGYAFDQIFDDDPEFDRHMWPTAATFASESDPATGILTLVSVQTWATKAVALSEGAARR